MKSKNVLVITYWSFLDPLVQSYTLPYVRIIRKNIPSTSTIYLVTFEQRHLNLTSENQKQVEDALAKQGIVWIRYAYARFGSLAIFNSIAVALKLWRVCKKSRIDYIHAWCTPAGSLAYILSRLTGRRF